MYNLAFIDCRHARKANNPITKDAMQEIAAQMFPFPSPQQQSEASFIFFHSIVITGSVIQPAQPKHIK